MQTGFWDSGVAGARTLFAQPFRAKQVAHWAARKFVSDPARMTNLPQDVRDVLQERAVVQPVAELQRLYSKDGSVKFLLQGPAGRYEMIWMPFATHNTLCISSQAGCLMGCTFCATATLGAATNLTAGEIIGQVLHASSHEYKVDRVVFMGMGEPMANYENVARALEWLTHKDAFAWSPDRVTVSTVGLIPAMTRYWEEQKTHLAISLNGFDNASRESWMPVGRKYSFDDLVAWANARDTGGRRRITFEYILSGGSTDTLTAARALARSLRGSRVRVNVIPWNAWGSGGTQPTDEESITAFTGYLARNHIRVTVRRSRGLDIDGACGQLVTSDGNQADRT